MGVSPIGALPFKYFAIFYWTTIMGERGASFEKWKLLQLFSLTLLVVIVFWLCLRTVFVTMFFSDIANMKKNDDHHHHHHHHFRATTQFPTIFAGAMCDPSGLVGWWWAALPGPEGSEKGWSSRRREGRHQDGGQGQNPGQGHLAPRGVLFMLCFFKREESPTSAFKRGDTLNCKEYNDKAKIWKVLFLVGAFTSSKFWFKMVKHHHFF